MNQELHSERHALRTHPSISSFGSSSPPSAPVCRGYHAAGASARPCFDDSQGGGQITKRKKEKQSRTRTVSAFSSGVLSSSLASFPASRPGLALPIVLLPLSCLACPAVSHQTLLHVLLSARRLFASEPFPFSFRDLSGPHPSISASEVQCVHACKDCTIAP